MYNEIDLHNLLSVVQNAWEQGKKENRCQEILDM